MECGCTAWDGWVRSRENVGLERLDCSIFGMYSEYCVYMNDACSMWH